MTMKCPFRTKTVTEVLEPNKRKAETVEFAECLGYECPYYGKQVYQHRATGGFEWVTEPGCRRVDNG